MIFKASIIASTLAILFAGQALAVPEGVGIAIATDPKSACRCPRNCNHHEGSGCKYYAGSSDKSSVVQGKCGRGDGGLVCIP